MKPSRVYHRGPLEVGREAVLDEAASSHLTRVLRMRLDEPLVLFDGRGGEYRGRIRSLERNGVRVRIEQFVPLERESSLAVGLAQAVSAGELMDLTVQKAIELGVAWIQPLIAERAKVRLAGERAQRRVAHWQRVAIAACEQCGRNRVPAVMPLALLPDWLGGVVGGAQCLLLDPGAQKRLSQAGPLAGELLLLVGPESGFSAEESAMALHRGFQPVSLGPRVLRTETAGLAALAALQALWGDA